MSGPLLTYNHAVERFDAAAQSAGWTLTALAIAGIAALSLSINDDPEGFAVLASATVIGAYPFGAWSLRWRRSDRLAVDRLKNRDAELIQQATSSVAKLDELAQASPAGPIHDHLVTVATTARSEVCGLYQRLLTTSQNTAHGNEMLGTLRQLERSAKALVDTQLVVSAFTQTEPSRLENLAIETQQIESQLKNLN